MPNKTGTGRGKKLAGKYRQKKRKVEETEDEGVQEAGTDSPRNERREMNPKRCLEKSQSGSLSPQQSERSPPPQQSQETQQDPASPPPSTPPRSRQTKSSDDEGNYNLR